MSSVYDPNNGNVYVTDFNSNESPGNTVSVISTTTPVQPPTHTTIASAIDGNGAEVSNSGSTVSISITFQVTATAGTKPITGFQCSLDRGIGLNPSKWSTGEWHSLVTRCFNINNNTGVRIQVITDGKMILSVDRGTLIRVYVRFNP